jgi:hypothetical protein
MRLLYCTMVALVFGMPSQADDALSFEFSGKASVGWLDFLSVSGTGRGHSYNSAVAQVEAGMSVDYAISDTLSVGLVGNATARKGGRSDYEGINLGFGAVPGEFDDFSLDLAAYLSAGPLVLSYGEMESSFGFATIEIGNGNSQIKAGGAVRLNIGGGAGIQGVPLSDTSPSAPTLFDYKTVRADLGIADFVFSVSASESSRDDAKSAGLRWSRELSDVTVTAGLGYEDGTTRDFRSASLAVQYGGLALVANAVRQDVASGSIDNNILYRGYSVSYDFGGLEFGVAMADQAQTYTTGPVSVFTGDAQAFWISWEIDERSQVDFEMSRSDYLSGADVEATSLAYSLDF